MPVVSITVCLVKGRREDAPSLGINVLSSLLKATNYKNTRIAIFIKTNFMEYFYDATRKHYFSFTEHREIIMSITVTESNKYSSFRDLRLCKKKKKTLINSPIVTR